jgi:hypothetical protein
MSTAPNVFGWVACGYCYATSLGAPPHGQGQPCPMKVATEATYVAMMEAQAASHNRSGFAMNDMTSILKKMTGQEEDE